MQLSSKFTFAFATASLLALAGCATPLPHPVPDNPGNCGAGRVQHFVGKHLNPRNETAIRAMSRAGEVRILFPDSAATMDYRQDRLNINLGHKRKIIRLSCG
ncbi:hypothetical protein DMP17_05770 [Pseudonocardia sp. TMWB2A]|uniref:I78 family peptidase inhibitor n=1 Tax=Pseudonocardia sp. TMWB2A TaxID=687430 RepID=UPI00307E4DF3